MNLVNLVSVVRTLELSTDIYRHFHRKFKINIFTITTFCFYYCSRFGKRTDEVGDRSQLQVTSGRVYRAALQTFSSNYSTGQHTMRANDAFCRSAYYRQQGCPLVEAHSQIVACVHDSYTAHLSSNCVRNLTQQEEGYVYTLFFAMF